MKRLAMGLLIAVAAVAAAVAVGYRRETVAGIQYHVYVCEPADLGVYWADTNGVPFRTFAAVESNLVARGDTIQFMMNGGIFEPGGIPAGLLVQDGQVRRPVNTREGEGNFYLKPNGVFHVDDQGAHIEETGTYLANRRTPMFAVQSGPLLLLNGKIHPAFSAASTNRLHRNGVGVLADGKVLLAITEPDQAKRPTLHEFALFFKQQGCAQALFLDGVLSQFVVHPRTNNLTGNHFGSILVVRKKESPPGP